MHVTTDATFEADIASGLVLVDFWAEWCGPCQAMLPRLEEFAKTQTDVKVVKCNVDECGETASKFRIMSIPTIIVFKDGVRVEQAVGLKTGDELIEMVAKHR
jgi:thioredoxin 1